MFSGIRLCTSPTWLLSAVAVLGQSVDPRPWTLFLVLVRLSGGCVPLLLRAPVCRLLQGQMYVQVQGIRVRGKYEVRVREHTRCIKGVDRVGVQLVLKSCGNTWRQLGECCGRHCHRLRAMVDMPWSLVVFVLVRSPNRQIGETVVK